MRDFFKKGIRLIKNARFLSVAILATLLQTVDIGMVYSQNTGNAIPVASQQNKKRITGTVTDPDGEPLVGVTVQILNSGVGTITNAKGLYVIDVRSTDVLSFSYISFVKQEVPVKGQDVLNITLKPDAQMMEDVVVVGYGKQKRAGMVSSISSVTSKQLVAPTGNLTNNLSGQLAGLISIQRSAEPGRDDAEFWIRGISTFKGGTNPLILVDGVPREISNIEPDEIETFTLLKDAAATAVYGAEGANGVILVTSKRGTISKPRISLRSEYSVATPQRLPKFVDSWDYLELALSRIHISEPTRPS
jgi:TonB-dependent SusC/RagA subfamily outer membrane receptor